MQVETFAIESRLAAIVDSSADAIISKSLDGRILTWNKAAEEIFGYTAPEAIGQPITMLFPQDRLREADVILDGIKHGQRRWRFDTVRVRKDGREIPVNITLSPILDATQKIVGVSKVARDLSGHRWTQNALPSGHHCLQRFVQFAPLAIAMFDREMRYLAASRRWISDLKLDERNILGQSHYDLFPEIPERWRQFHERSLRGEVIKSDDDRFDRLDGTTHWVRWETQPWMNDADEIGGIVIFAEEITNYKLIAERLRESETRLAGELTAMKQLHALSSRLFVTTDSKAALDDVLQTTMSAIAADFGNIQLMDAQNDALEIVVQRGFQKEFLDHFHAVRDGDGSACSQAMRDGGRISIEDTHQDDRFSPHRAIADAAGFRAVQSTPIKSSNGRILGILSTHFRNTRRLIQRDKDLLDLFARHAAYVIERDGNKQVLRDSAIKDEFLATLAHELRNPLAPISSAIQLIQKMESNHELLPKLGSIIERNVTQMVRLVDDLLEVSRITLGKIDLQMERLDLAAIVERAIETSDPLIRAGRHTLEVSKSPEPVVVMGDHVRLIQVVANLLNNAAKYTPAGGQIWITIKRRMDTAELRIRDSGPGIPAAMLTQVFELFTQLPENQHPSHRGLGIGLSLVKRIVEMHGGMVEARHATAGGAEFVVRIPLAVDQLPNAVSAKKVSEELPVKCCRVLVVDDNADAADSLAMLLAAAGHVTCVAYDGQAAMERARTFSPTAILLDLGMPGIDGFEVARRIRGLPGGEQIVLIALTGWGQERDRHRTSAAGFDVHLVKPVTASDLQTALGLVPRFGSECANDERFDHRSIKSYVSHEKANIDRDEKQCDLIGVDDTRRSKERISQISHDIVGCLFGIRCATDVLNGLQLNETSARMVRGISSDCQKIQDLIAAAQVIWIHQE